MGRWWMVLGLWACGGDDGDTPELDAPGLADNVGVTEDLGLAGCDNLVVDGCLYPFPSRGFIDS